MFTVSKASPITRTAWSASVGARPRRSSDCRRVSPGRTVMATRSKRSRLVVALGWAGCAAARAGEGCSPAETGSFTVSRQLTASAAKPAAQISSRGA